MKNGKQNEIDIMSAISGLTYHNLDEKWKKHMKRMFPEIKDDDVIHACFYHDAFAKPDIVITVNDRSVNLSIKSGRNPSCHSEIFSDFSAFLVKLGVPSRIMKIITFYQFGKSDKLSNNGEVFSREYIQKEFKNYIQEVNDYFLNHPRLVKEIIYRALIRGTRYRASGIGYFYYGNATKGFLMSNEDIYKEILEDRFEGCRAIHFYGLVFQPNGRRVDRVEHLYVRIKWPKLCVWFYDDEFNEKYS